MKCTKMRDARAKLLFCQSKPIAFLLFSLPSRSSSWSSLLISSLLFARHRGGQEKSVISFLFLASFFARQWGGHGQVLLHVNWNREWTGVDRKAIILHY